MRIRDGKGGGSSSGRGRSETFRRNHKIGQKIRGRFIEKISSDMGWVVIDGQKLLANLNSTPSPGSLLTFRVVQLSPQIILKELFAPGFSGNPEFSRISDFETARTLFENRARTVLSALCEKTGHERKHDFFSALQQDRNCTDAFLDVTACAASLTASMNSGQTILYAPWLVPEGNRSVLICHPSLQGNTNFLSLTVECTFPRFGLTRVQVLAKPPRAGIKLLLEHPRHGPQLHKILRNVLTAKAEDTSLLGIEKLPPHAHGGILSELLLRRSS